MPEPLSMTRAAISSSMAIDGGDGPRGAEERAKKRGRTRNASRLRRVSNNLILKCQYCQHFGSYIICKLRTRKLRVKFTKEDVEGGCPSSKFFKALYEQKEKKKKLNHDSKENSSKVDHRRMNLFS